LIPSFLHHTKDNLKVKNDGINLDISNSFDDLTSETLWLGFRIKLIFDNAPDVSKN